MSCPAGRRAPGVAAAGRTVTPRLVAAVAALAMLVAGCADPAANPASGATTTVAAPSRPPGAFTPPPVGARVSYQLGGPYDPPPGVTVVDRDHTVDPAPDTYGICYVNAFQAETAEVQDWQREHPDALLRRDGALVVDERWDEPLLDTSTADKRTAILAKVGGWIDECARRGYQAVELDNLDAATRSQGQLTDDDSFALAGGLITRAHAKGLAVAQKNAAELSVRGRSIGFDLAVAEECQVYDECGIYSDVYGTALVEVEYTDTPPAAFTTACARRATTASVVLRDRDVTPAGANAHVERWCPQAFSDPDAAPAPGQPWTGGPRWWGRPRRGGGPARRPPAPARRRAGGRHRRPTPAAGRPPRRRGRCRGSPPTSRG